MLNFKGLDSLIKGVLGKELNVMILQDLMSKISYHPHIGGGDRITYSS